LGQGYAGIGNTREAVYPPVRCLLVAAPALPLFPVIVSLAGEVFNWILCQEVLMAPDTVVLDHLLACFFDVDNLRFQPEGEHGSMPHPVFCLKVVFIQDIIMRYVAVIAMGVLTM